MDSRANASACLGAALAAGAGVSVGGDGPIGVSPGSGVGVSSGSDGPIGASVAVGVCVGVSVGVLVGVGVSVGRGVQVGKGVGVGLGGPGRATTIKLITMLPANRRLINQNMVWLKLLFCFRLLTTRNLPSVTPRLYHKVPYTSNDV